MCYYYSLTLGTSRPYGTLGLHHSDHQVFSQDEIASRLAVDRVANEASREQQARFVYSQSKSLVAHFP